MRRWLLVALVAVAACNGGEAATTSTSTSPAVVPAPTTLPPATTTVPEQSTTTPPVTTTPPPPSTTLPPATTTTVPVALAPLAYEEVARLPFPVQVTARPGDDIAYVITKNGVVWALQDGSVLVEPVLDISGRVRNSGEQGLLSIALHPTNRSVLYLHYSDVGGDTTVSEFRLVSPVEADPSSERILLSQDQPARNHNGGMILVDPNGHLLVGLGDGGGAGDRFGNGQNTDTLLGGLVQLDVTGDPDPALFAYGLRNPWRFWIDEGLIYIADVGQDAYEEIDVQPFRIGANYGWPILEAFHCYGASSDCDRSNLVLPAIEIPHGDAGTCSITGGVVYRGEDIPELTGQFLFSDYCGGYLRGLRFTSVDRPPEVTDWTGQVGVPGAVLGFGLDGAGEVYVATTDTLFRLVAER